jgi:hypothetical protein
MMNLPFDTSSLSSIPISCTIHQNQTNIISSKMVKIAIAGGAGSAFSLYPKQSQSLHMTKTPYRRRTRNHRRAPRYKETRHYNPDAQSICSHLPPHLNTTSNTTILGTPSKPLQHGCEMAQNRLLFRHQPRRYPPRYTYRAVLHLPTPRPRRRHNSADEPHRRVRSSGSPALRAERVGVVRLSSSYSVTSTISLYHIY